MNGRQAGKITNGVHAMAIQDPDDLGDDDFKALDQEMDQLNSELDKMENWSTSLHDKVADLLKETQEKNKAIASASTEEKSSANNENPTTVNDNETSDKTTNDNDKSTTDKNDSKKKDDK